MLFEVCFGVGIPFLVLGFMKITNIYQLRMKTIMAVTPSLTSNISILGDLV